MTLAGTAVGPFHFERPGGRRLYGFLHAPADGVAVRDVAVVLTYPLAHEYARSHRAFQKLATLLEARGHFVLRYDPIGVGDSDGELTDARFDDWLDDLAVAVAEVRRRSDCRRVALVGMRLGATLATRFAATRPDIDGVALWDVVVRGAEYVRELEELQAEIARTTSARFRGPLLDPGGMEVLGYELSSDLVGDVRSIDLSRLDAAPAPAILLAISAPDVDERFAEVLRRLGSTVTIRHHPSPEGLGDDPFKPRIPGPILASIASWLDEVSQA